MFANFLGLNFGWGGVEANLDPKNGGEGGGDNSWSIKWFGQLLSFVRPLPFMSTGYGYMS